MTERDILLKKLSSYQFMIDDLKLYLDTHPKDKGTIEKLEEYKEKLMPIQKTYEEKYGPLFSDDGAKNKWKWVKAPWPWESEEDI